MNLPAVSVGERARGISLPRASLPVLGATAVTILAGALRLSSLGRAASSPYYDAAVRSMGLSWHNFFFAAFDPTARLVIDKPPVDLWLQVLSVKLLGHDRQALILPEALAATAAVPLLFDTVRRVAGNAAGLIAAVALAVMPVSVETGRSDTMDSLMMALCVLAAWMAVRAAQTGQRRWIIAAGIAMGTSFEVKLLEGLLALPAIVALYAIASPHPWRRRLTDGLAALAAFLVAALWWPVAVTLAAPSPRPFAIGSTDGSVWSAIFYYNGLQRLSPQHVPATQLVGSGAPGPGRLFSLGGAQLGQHLGVELAPALAFALAGLVLAIAGSRRAWAAERPASRRLAVGGGVAAALWIGVCFAVFSSMRSDLHLRYVDAMAPAVAAVLGAGVAACARACAHERGLRGVLAAALTVAAALAGVIYGLAADPGDPGTRTLLIVATVVAGMVALAWVGLRTWRVRSSAAALAVLAIVAVAGSTASLAVPAQRAQLISQLGATDGGSPGSHSAPIAIRAQRYLATHARNDHYSVVVSSYLIGASIITHGGRPLVLTSVDRRQVVSRSELRSAVRAGLVHYALIGGRCGSARLNRLAGCPALEKWIRRRSVDVSRAAGYHTRGWLLRFVAGRT